MEEERKLYDAVLRDLTNLGPLRVYAHWLSARSDPRAAGARALIAGLRGGPIEPWTADRAWATSLGLPVVEALAASGHLAALPALLGHTELGWEMVEQGDPSAQTHLFGDPDLPPALPWPTHGDCKMWQPAAEIDPSVPCRFVCQLELGELSGPGLPSLGGLLSVFVFGEFDEVGTAGVVLHHFPAGTALETRRHPSADWANERGDPVGITFRYVRMLPDGGCLDGPWVAAAKALEEPWRAALKPLSCGHYGVYGHLRKTTGSSDPTPSAEHRRLLVLPADREGLCSVHLAIRKASLWSGSLVDAELVWVDFDGDCLLDAPTGGWEL